MEPTAGTHETNPKRFFLKERFFKNLKSYEHKELFGEGNAWEALNNIEPYIRQCHNTTKK